MSRNSAGSVFGGAGGRGTRVSIASLEGLRSVLHKDPEGGDFITPSAAAAAAAAAPAADDKKTMRGLNERLSGYLGRVKDMTMDNARLLLQIDNSKLANDDFQNKKIIDDTQMNRLQLESQVESVNEELAILKKDHAKDVEALHQKIQESSVLVEVDSPDSNLAENLNKVRAQYDKLAKKNQKETNAWYQSKFENIKVEEAQSTEIHSVDESLTDTQAALRAASSPGMRRQPAEAWRPELGQLRDQVKHQVDEYQHLLHAEIENYRQLMHGITGRTGQHHRSLKETKKTADASKPHQAPSWYFSIREFLHDNCTMY
ncbi:hypothetical protein CRUP_010680 [Coryphaenoides rupestris]|nr:hypothetical protein CRUP_010680 [Coryphaenoides rupestris]